MITASLQLLEQYYYQGITGSLLPQETFRAPAKNPRKNLERIFREPNWRLLRSAHSQDGLRLQNQGRPVQSFGEQLLATDCLLRRLVP